MSRDRAPRTKAQYAGVALAALVALALAWGAIGQALSQPQQLGSLGIELIGQTEWLSGGPVSIRVVVTDHALHQPARNAWVNVQLIGAEGTPAWRQYAGRTDALGTLRAQFTLPDLEPGQYELRVTARRGADSDIASQRITLKRGYQVLLTTDKPIYQPGQVIHIRALALRQPTMKAVASHEVTVEVADAKGNKVFKQQRTTNAYGIASADFQLADEVNMGRWGITVKLDQMQTEKKVTVERYVLPKFRVKLDTDKPFYLPGETVRGTLQADYFFGQPVARAAVQVSVKTFDVQLTEIALVEGRTDAKGHWDFEAKLPDSFVGQPIEQGNAYLQFDVKVTDPADHSEQVTTTAVVAAADLQVNALPEAGRLIPGVENTLLCLISDPTGRPVAGRVRVTKIEPLTGGKATLAQSAATSDDMGIAELGLTYEAPEGASAPVPVMWEGPMMRPGPPRPGFGGGASSPSVRLHLIAEAGDGRRVERDIELSSDLSAPQDALLLRTDRALYAVGDTVRATVISPARRGTIFFDLIKDRQTMLTRAADLSDGRAAITIPVSAELSGGIYLSCYRIMPSGNVVRDTRPLYVQPASELQIGIHPNQDTYAPGSPASVAFTVTGKNGQPVQAALGINIVDEAVFALQDLQPGMEKVYFYLEQELMKPRYEIHGLDMSAVIGAPPTPGPGPVVPLEQDQHKQQAARVIFASSELPDLPSFQVDSYADRLAKARAQWTEQMRPLVEHIQNALNAYQNKYHEWPPAEGGIDLMIRRGLLKEQDLYDPWHRRMVVKPPPYQDRLYSLLVGSLGPDGLKGTEDDLWMMSNWGAMAWNSEEKAGQGGGHMMFRLGAVDAAAPMAMPGPMGPPGMGGGPAAEGMMPGQPVAATGGGEQFAERSTVRVRTEFPETLLFEPALITDEQGRATLNIPSVKDSITTFRLGAIANSSAGELGSATGSMRVYLDFHIDADLPVALTQNDQVSIPVSVRNFMDQPQRVRLELEPQDWFDAQSPLQQELEIGAGEVKGVYFTIVARKVGLNKLKIYGLGTKMSDAVENTIRVEPDGQMVEQSINDRLTGNVSHTVRIPQDAVADGSNIFVKIYPGIFSQAVEGLDKILQMPSGCFEQTSSATYPNILVLDYMKQTGQINPEIRMKAEGFINTGYQRLVSYEVPGGGFSWFGSAPANKILTSYGLMEFYDMDQVQEVDPALIARTQQWLLGQQNPDGSWDADKEYLHQESWGRIQNSQLPPTAYITWALCWSQSRGAGLDKAVAWLRAHWKEAEDPYTLALVANALVSADNLLAGGKLSDTTTAALEALLAKAKRGEEKLWWESDITGLTHSSGKSADLEATGLAALAFISSGRYPQVATQVLNYLISAKDPNGTWYSTQATVLALRSLLLAQKGTTSKVNAEVSVDINGQRAWAQAINDKNSDLMFQVDCKPFVKPGDNRVEIKFAGEGTALYQIVTRYYKPWPRQAPPPGELLSIGVDYDKTKLAVSDTVTATATIKNNSPARTSMVLVDLGVPPGFTVDPTDFTDLVDRQVISKFTLTGRQIIVYLEQLDPGQTVTFSYKLTARFPIKAQTPSSTVYEYYNPDNRSSAAPVEMEVAGG